MLGGERVDRVNELLRHELGEVLSRELELPEGTLVTVTNVQVSQDLAHAKVWVSVLPFDRTEETLALMTKSVGTLQHILNRKLRMEPVPRIRFLVDEHEHQAARIEQILDSLDDGV